MAKRTLTGPEKQAAARFRDAFLSSGETQESLAMSVGVSQGMIWQWLNERSPIPARRAASVAVAVGVSPETISEDYRVNVLGGNATAEPRILRREPHHPIAEPRITYAKKWTAPIGKKQAALVLAAQTMAGRLPDDVAEAITNMIMVSAGAAHGTEDAPGAKAKP